MYRILLVDFSIFKDSLRKMLEESGYEVIHCESAYNAMASLKAHDFDLVVSEVELPGDNAFDLYNYIRRHYPYIPIIMTTEKNIDHFFDHIFHEGIGNVLCKPVKKDEMLRLAEKLISKEKIFDLANYIDNITDLKKIRITNSLQIQKAIKVILDQMKQWGFHTENEMSLILVLNELTVNAVYHSHGFTREKEQRIPVTLDNGYVDLFFCYSENRFGISINDYRGKLTKETILNSINKVIEQSNIIEEAARTGEDITGLISETGRGIDLVRKISGDYYFIIRQNVRTEIILIFDRTYHTDDGLNYSSLKIIEDLQ